MFLPPCRFLLREVPSKSPLHIYHGMILRIRVPCFPLVSSHIWSSAETLAVGDDNPDVRTSR